MTVLVLFLQTTDLTLMVHVLQKLLKVLRPGPANANLVQRVPLSFFTFLRNLQNRTRLKGPLFDYFGTVRLSCVHCELF